MSLAGVHVELDQAGREHRSVCWRQVAVVVGVIGVLLRIRRFATGQSFWLDEAMLAQNFVDRGPLGLLDPLRSGQVAPVGYLWTVDGLHAVFGLDERWMRSPALLAGIALLPLTWLLARRLGTERVAALSVALVALSPGLIRYSSELKQYSSDAAICVALLAAAPHLGRLERTGVRAVAVAALGGAVAMWFSHTAALALAGIGLVWAVRSLIARDRALAGRLVLVGAVWSVNLAAVYLANLRVHASNEYLTSYWQTGFPDSALPWDLAAWAWTNTSDLLATLGGHTAASLVALAALAGAIVLGRKRPWDVALVLAPFGVLAVAATLEVYPYRGRLSLFYLPVVLTLVAGLADAPGWWRRAGTAVVCVSLVTPGWRAAEELVDPLRFPESSSAVDFLLEHLEPDHAVYATEMGQHPFVLYASGSDVELTGTTGWLRRSHCDDDRPLDQMSGQAWFFFAYTHSGRPEREREIMLSQLDAAGDRLLIHRGYDAFAALYDFDARPSPPSATPLDTEATGCLTVHRR